MFRILVHDVPPRRPHRTHSFVPFVARLHLTAQGSVLRSMFIQVRDTPNANSLMFLPGRAVLPAGTAHFNTPGEAKSSPLAKYNNLCNYPPLTPCRALFRVDGVKQVFLASDFVTIVKVAYCGVCFAFSFMRMTPHNGQR